MGKEKESKPKETEEKEQKKKKREMIKKKNFFLGLYLRQMEVPRPGVKSEL